jgi:hypothetical protein
LFPDLPDVKPEFFRLFRYFSQGGFPRSGQDFLRGMGIFFCQSCWERGAIFVPESPLVAYNKGMIEPNLDWVAIVADRKIKEAMDAGEFDDLEGKGQPINLDEDPFTSIEQRVANRLLKNYNALPEWIQIGQDIQKETDALGPARERGLRAIRYARNGPTQERAASRLRLDYRDRIDLINTMILKYNYITPRAAQRAFRPLRLKQEMESLEADIRDALSGAAAPDE